LRLGLTVSIKPFAERNISVSGVGPLLARGLQIATRTRRHAAFRQAQDPEHSRRASGGPTSLQMAKCIRTLNQHWLNIQYRDKKQEKDSPRRWRETRRRDCLKSSFAGRKTRFQATTCLWRMDGDDCINLISCFPSVSSAPPWLFFH